MLAVAAMEMLLRSAHRIAVVGMKPESRRELAAHWVPEYMAQAGYDIVPVPSRYPEVETIFGVPVVRDLLTLRWQPPDLVNVFLRPEREPDWADALVAVGAPVWFQSGCLHEPTADLLAAHGIPVAHDCIACRHAAMVGHRRSPPGAGLRSK